MARVLGRLQPPLPIVFHENEIDKSVAKKYAGRVSWRPIICSAPTPTPLELKGVHTVLCSALWESCGNGTLYLRRPKEPLY